MVNEYYKDIAKSNFRHLRMKVFFKKFASLFTKKTNRLYSFEEIKNIVRPYKSEYLGVQEIDVDNIIGSLGKYKNFDNEFLPMSDNEQDRWTNVQEAVYEGRELPPISVFKISEFYFVEDGNNRVSVAKNKGQQTIHAEVTEFKTRVPIKRQMSEDDMRLIDEHSHFLEQTRIGEIIKNVDIELSEPDGYAKLADYIEKYIEVKRLKKKKGYSWEKGIKKWYKKLYKPLIKIIREKNLVKKFQTDKEGDVFVWIMDYWMSLHDDFLRKKEIKQAVKYFLEDKDMMKKYKK